MRKQAITVDGSRWELEQPSAMNSLFGSGNFAWARPWGLQEGEFKWRVVLSHVVAYRDWED